MVSRPCQRSKMNASTPAPAYLCVVCQSHRPLRHLGASIQTFPAVLAGNQAVLKRLRVAAHHPVAPLFGLLSACLGGAGASVAFLVAHDAAGAAALSHHRTAYARRPPPPRSHPVAAPRCSSNRAGSAFPMCRSHPINHQQQQRLRTRRPCPEPQRGRLATVRCPSSGRT